MAGESGWRRFEYRAPGSAAFWAIRLEESAYRIRFGRIGAAGRERIRSFASDDDARAACDRIVREKLRKGYVEVAGDAGAPAPAREPVPRRPPAAPRQRRTATARSRLGLAVVREDLAGVRRLLAEGADPNEICDGAPLLAYAQHSGRGGERIAVALLEAGADPVPARGYLNLVWAVGTRRLDLVRRFLEAGAEPNVRALGGTPLRRAAALGEREMVKLLVEAGADLDALDDEGQSALALAQRFGHEEVSRVLREAGARARTERAPARRRGAARDPDAEREVAPERKAAARPPAPGLPSLKDLRRRYDRAQVVARLRSGCDGEAYLAAIAELEALCGSPRRDERDTLGGFSLHVPSGRELDLEALQERLLARGVLVFASETGARSGAAGRLVALPTRDRYDALAVMRTNGANEGQGPEHIIRWLLDRETTHPFVLTAVAFDTLRGRFLDPIGDPEELAQSMYELCSDVVERGTETVEALAELLAGTRQLLFWWD